MLFVLFCYQKRRRMVTVLGWEERFVLVLLSVHLSVKSAVASVPHLAGHV